MKNNKIIDNLHIKHFRYFQRWVFILLSGFIFIQSTIGQNENVIYQRLDTIIFQRYIHAFNAKKHGSAGDLMVQTGVFLMDAPYMAKTLELCGKTERLVVNLRQFDPVTLVENCMALVHSLKSKDQSFDAFCNELRDIRYRNGSITDFSSRLHYFTEWISNNETKGKVINLTAAFGGKRFVFTPDFITRNATLYPAMSSPEIRSEMLTVEQNLSHRVNFYIPKSLPVGNKIRNGDILCLTSNVSGLGISHVGIAFRLGGVLYMIHASAKDNKVEITPDPFLKYIAPLQNITGYMVVRPL
jgi:hypothetical protein